MDKYSKYEEWITLCKKYPHFSPFILLKLSCICHGVRLSIQTLERVQKEDYCFSTVEPFGIGFEGRDKKKVMPGAILLRDASFVYINYGENYLDPYTVEYNPETDEFFLYEKDLKIDSIDFVPRPQFFGKYTSTGILMDTLADVRAQKLILTAFQKCLFWNEGKQCHYCAFFTNKNRKAEIDENDLYEVTKEALKEKGRFSELYLSGGSDFRGEEPFKDEIERYIRVLKAIGRNFNSRFPSQLMAPAYKKEDVKRIYEETKITSYCPNIEVWDKELFKTLCPGKEKWVGYDEWIKRTVDSVEIFGKGNVYTQIVAGCECAKPHGFDSLDDALKSNIEGAEFFSSHGVICLTTIWRPHKNSRLGYQKMPPLEYYVRLAKEFHDIRKSFGLVSTDDDYKCCGNHIDSDLERGDFV